MDLPRSLKEMIDLYISEALAVTGTRWAPRPLPPHLAGASGIASEIDEEVEIEIEADEPSLEHDPEASDFLEEVTTWMAHAIVIEEDEADAALLAQLNEQLAYGEGASEGAGKGAIEPLPRSRAPRGTVEIDDEVTNVAKKKPSI